MSRLQPHPLPVYPFTGGGAEGGCKSGAGTGSGPRSPALILPPPPPPPVPVRSPATHPHGLRPVPPFVSECLTPEGSWVTDALSGAWQHPGDVSKSFLVLCWPESARREKGLTFFGSR